MRVLPEKSTRTVRKSACNDAFERVFLGSSPGSAPPRFPALFVPADEHLQNNCGFFCHFQVVTDLSNMRLRVVPFHFELSAPVALAGHGKYLQFGLNKAGSKKTA